MFEDTPDDVSEIAWQQWAEVVDYLSCVNVRNEWEGELPELLRPGAGGSRCRTGRVLCECLTTGEPCLFAYLSTGEVHYWRPPQE